MINDLEKFIKVIETSNITKASEELHITQPALSLAIQKLEKFFKTKLLIRNKKGVKTTKQGEILYKSGKKILTEFNNAKVNINDLCSILDSNVNIGMIDNISDKFIKNVYYSIQKKHKDIMINIIINNTKNLIQEIKNGNLDFAIITSTDIDNNLVSINLTTEKLLLLKPINSSVPKIIPLISYNKNSNTHRLIEESLKKHKCKFEIKSFSTSPQAILEMIKHKMGFGVLPQNIADKYIGKSIEEVDPNISIDREILLIYKKDKYLPHIQKEVIEYIRMYI